MKAFVKFACGFVLLLYSGFAPAQIRKYTTANAHAHNDYRNARPFYLAYENGFGSIEADVFSVNGILCVAHSKEEIAPDRTLKNLYIEPLLRKLTSDSARKLILLIDIKDDYRISLPLLVKELAPLQPYLSSSEKANYLTVVISGNRPPPGAYAAYPSFIFFDDDLKRSQAVATWAKVALVSLPFNKISAWKGEDVLDRKDRKKLRRIIDSVHAAGKPIRFWAAPDTKTSWKQQMKLGVDLIGTDRVSELSNFLKKEQRRAGYGRQRYRTI